MFTIGIFSTHIPYIAFVLFYAYFLITGVNKAVAGEIQSGENYTKTELFASETFNPQKPDTYHYYCEISNTGNNNSYKELIFNQKIRYPDFVYAKIQNNYFSFQLFNRPPPIA